MELSDTICVKTGKAVGKYEALFQEVCALFLFSPCSLYANELHRSMMTDCIDAPPSLLVALMTLSLPSRSNPPPLSRKGGEELEVQLLLLKLLAVNKQQQQEWGAELGDLDIGVSST